MKKEKECFVLKKEITGLAIWQKDFLEKCFEAGRQISNAIKGKKLDDYNKMISLSEYMETKQKCREIRKKLEKDKENKELQKELKAQYAILNEIYGQYGFYKMAFLSKDIYGEHLEKYSKYLDAGIIQSVAEDVWTSYEKLLYGEGKKVHFIKFGNFSSLRARTNNSFLRYNLENDTIVIGRRNGEVHKQNKKNGTNKFTGQLIINIPRNFKDDFETKAFKEHNIKYCILKREYIRKKIKYYLEIVFDGISPNAEKMKQQWNGVGTLGIDVGVQHLATYNDRTLEANMFEIAEDCNNPHKRIAEIRRKMDRSRRGTNQQQFNKDGTINKGKKCKIRSNHYKKLLLELKELYRKPAAKRKLYWESLSKKMVLESENIFIEDESYKIWQERFKEGKGKKKKKKHYGCYIENKAPSEGVELIKRKSNYVGIPMKKIGVNTVKATQYNHLTDSFDTDKKLTDRWNHDKRDTQRDLTSAMYITCIKDDKIDKKIVKRKWNDFKNSHNELINQIIEENKNGKLLLGAMGIQQRYPNISLKSNNINAH